MGVAGEIGMFGEWAWAGDRRGQGTSGGEPWCGRSLPQAPWPSVLDLCLWARVRTLALLSGPPPPLTLGQDASQVLLGVCPLYTVASSF